MTTFTWPDARQALMFASVNFDAEAQDLKLTDESRLYGRYSYGRYGVRAGLPRLLEFADRHQLALTFFVCATDALRHPDEVRACARAGHEIACRGWDLSPLPELGSSESVRLRDATDALTNIIGEPIKGFRAATGDLSHETLAILTELDYDYDSSFQDADHPYLIDTGTRSLVEIPTYWSLHDALPYSARHTHARVIKIWKEEIEALYDEGCLIPLVMHLRGDVGFTRAARLKALGDLLQQLKAGPDLISRRGSQIAQWTRSLAPASEPLPHVTHAEILKTVTYRGDLTIQPL